MYDIFVARARQKIFSDEGIDSSQQSVAIRGATQRLEDSVTLEECCVAGVEVGGFAPAGWGELHLVLRVKQPTLPSDSHLNVRKHVGCSHKSLP